MAAQVQNAHLFISSPTYFRRPVEHTDDGEHARHDEQESDRHRVRHARQLVDEDGARVEVRLRGASICGLFPLEAVSTSGSGSGTQVAHTAILMNT